MSDVFQLRNKLVVVTGSTLGIGRAIAAAFARQGARVVVNGRSKASVDAAIAKEADASIRSQYIPVVADVSTRDGAEALISAVAGLGQAG